MLQAIRNRTGVAILLQPYLLIPDCANQYCFAGVFRSRPRAAYRPIPASIDSSGGNSGGKILGGKAGGFPMKPSRLMLAAACIAMLVTTGHGKLA